MQALNLWLLVYQDPGWPQGMQPTTGVVVHNAHNANSISLGRIIGIQNFPDNLECDANVIPEIAERLYLCGAASLSEFTRHGSGTHQHKH